MRMQQAWRTGWVTRTARGLWPDHNPLRRASDRAEAGMVALLVGAFVLGAPLLVLLTWRLTFNSTVTAADAVHHGWRQVPAVLLADEPVWTGGYAPSVPVRWVTPDGVQHTGQFLAAPGARAGTTVTVWTDDSGRLAEPPLTRRQAVSQASFAAALAIPIWALALLGGGMLGRHIIDRRRIAAWEIDWRASNLSGPAGASPGR